MTNNPPNEPRLSVEPDQLDFGDYRPGRPLSRQKTLTLKITNTGGGFLKGRLIRQVSWVILPTLAFQCQAGETSSHDIQISTGAPQVVVRERYLVDQLILVDSNAGSKMVSGSYQIGLTSDNKKVSVGILMLSLLLLVFIAGGYLLRGGFSGILVFQPEATDQQIQPDGGTETLSARVAQPQTTQAASQSPNRSAQTAPTQTPASTEAQTPAQNTNSTNTPWPREAFANPEEVVSGYYREINAGQYEAAWTMLSRDFQQTCCAISGNDPYTIYSQWWSHNIEKVEIHSAYLQEWDVNPAPVLVSISYYYKNGKIEDMIFMHYLVADSERNVLLIDEVR